MRWIGNILFVGVLIFGLLITLEIIPIADLEAAPRWFRILAGICLVVYGVFMYVRFIRDYRLIRRQRRCESRDDM
jgi:hypothetical protein